MFLSSPPVSQVLTAENGLDHMRLRFCSVMSVTLTQGFASLVCIAAGPKYFCFTFTNLNGRLPECFDIGKSASLEVVLPGAV